MNKGKMTITADLMYLIVLGDNTSITKIVDKMNDNNSIKLNSPKKSKHNDKQIVYIKHDMSVPCSELLDCDIIKDILKSDAIKKIKQSGIVTNDPTLQTNIEHQSRFVIPADGVESAQSFAYADINSGDKNNIDDLKMLLLIKETDGHYELTYPEISLGLEEDAGALVSRWLKTNDLNEIIKQIIVRPINIVGKDNEILVFTAFIKNVN